MSYAEAIFPFIFIYEAPREVKVHFTKIGETGGRYI